MGNARVNFSAPNWFVKALSAGAILALAVTPFLPVSSAQATAAVPLDPVHTFNCPGGGSYDVDDNHIASRGGQGQYLDSAGSVLPAGNCSGSVQIDSSAQIIEEFGFDSAPLTSVTLPNSLTTIRAGAFSNTTLTTLVIPNSVTTIGTSAFLGVGLSSLQLGSSLTSIGGSAFKDSTLTSLTLPNALTTIGGSAFRNSPITALEIPSSVTTIGSNAFNVAPLTSLIVRSPALTIGTAAFAGTATSNLACFYNLGGATFTSAALQTAGLPPVCVIYNISTSAGAHGSVANPYEYIDSGASPTYTITPDAGYMIDSASTDAGDVTSSLVAVSGETKSYTFAPVTGNNRLSVTFKPIPAPPAPAPAPAPSTPIDHSASVPEAPAPIPSPAPTETVSPSPTPTVTAAPAAPNRISIGGFARGSAVLPANAKRALAELASAVRGASKVVITGFTEGPTVLKADSALSRQRAMTVQEYLRKLLGKATRFLIFSQQSTRLGRNYRAVQITWQP